MTLEEFKRIFNTIKEVTRSKSVGGQVPRLLLLDPLDDDRRQDELLYLA